MADAQYILNIRGRIEAADLETARTAVLRFIRRAARCTIHRYAQRHCIIDFDSILVLQPHRNFENNAISVAQDLATSANAATEVAELLTIFDQISGRL